MIIRLQAQAYMEQYLYRRQGKREGGGRERYSENGNQRKISSEM